MIRPIVFSDHDDYVKFAKDFYNSEAVCHSIPLSNIEEAFSSFIDGNPFSDCYMIHDDDKNIGYVIVAKTYSQEAGGMVMWIDELYISPDYRGKGLGATALMYIEGKCIKDGYKRMRLEYTEGNRAEHLYKKMLYKPLVYKQMLKEITYKEEDNFKK